MIKKLIGRVGVDSGQLMICDPCYIASEWKNIPFKIIELYAHKKINKIFGYNQSKLGTLKIESFKNYESKTSTKKSMNEMIANKEVKKLDMPDEIKLLNTFSYAGICHTTLNDENQINYKLGNPGVAVAFRTGYGDGYYPVYGSFNKEGRCMKIEIIFY